MRKVQTLIVLSAILMLAAACGSSDDGPTAGSPTTAQPSATGGGGTSPTGGGGGGDASNSIVYSITGDYEASGELPFVAAASAFSNGGWSASFSASGDEIVVINSIPGSVIVNYGDPEIAVPGSEADGCTIEFTQNDASGLSGSFACTGVVTAMSQTGEQVTVDFSGQFDGHP